MPSKDFVLYVRDSGISKPTAISTITPSGRQALSLKMLPDTRSEHVKSRVMQEMQSRMTGSVEDAIDVESDICYGRNELEQMLHE